MAKNNKELMAKPSEEVSQALYQGFPQDQGYNRRNFSRLSLVSQDKTEGKGKQMKVVQEAGTFLKEFQSDELDENKKKIWKKEELGTEIEGTIVFQRKQLKMFDEETDSFISSAIYDNAEDVIPLFSNNAEIARGLPADLRAQYNFVDEKDGKTKSHLEENKILYVLYEGEVYQMNLRGTSMYACKTYFKEVQNPTVLLTKFSSEAKEKGSIAWNQMTFETVRTLSDKEAKEILEMQNEIRQGVQEEKAYFASLNGGQASGGSKPSTGIPSNEEVQKFLKENKDNG